MTQEIYRSCASVAVFRPSDAGFEMLLGHKPRNNDCGPLPQGGCESGESTMEAAIRELQEETGLVPEVIDTSEHIYQYDFPKSYRRFRPDNVKGQRIEYVFATVDPDAKVPVDEDEIDDYVWVSRQQITKYIKRKEYIDLVMQLYDDGLSLLHAS